MAVVRESIVFDTAQARPALDEVGLGLRNAADAADAAKETFGDVGSATQRLAGAASMISPELGGVVRDFADLADVGEVGAAVMGRLGLSFGGVVAVAGPVAVLIGLITAAWMDYEAEARAAEEAQRALTDALDDVQDIAKRSGAEIDRLRVSLGQWTQAQYDDAQINREWDRSLEEGTAKLRAQRDEILASAKDVSSTKEGWAAYNAQLAEVNRSIEQATTLNEQGRTAALANAEIARETAESERVLAERLKERAKTERETTQAVAQHRAEMAALAAQMASYLTALDAIQGITDNANKSQLDDYGKLAAARDEQLTAIMEQQKIATEASLGNSAALTEVDAAAATARTAVWQAYYDDLAELNARYMEQAKSAAAETTTALEAMMSGGLGQGLSGAVSVAQGGLSAGLGIVSQAGPVGAIIAQVIQLIQGIENGMIDQMHGEIMAIFEGLPDIPDQLAKGVEQSISEGMPALAEGLAGLIVNLPEAIFRGLVASFVDVPKAMAEALKSFLDELFDGIGERRRERQERRWALDHGSTQAMAENRSAGGGSTARGASAAARNTLRPSRGMAEDMGGQLWSLMNRSAARGNLRSSGGTPYGTSGSIRIVVGED